MVVVNDDGLQILDIRSRSKGEKHQDDDRVHDDHAEQQPIAEEVVYLFSYES